MAITILIIMKTKNSNGTKCSKKILKWPRSRDSVSQVKTEKKTKPYQEGVFIKYVTFYTYTRLQTYNIVTYTEGSIQATRYPHTK